MKKVIIVSSVVGLFLGALSTCVKAQPSTQFYAVLMCPTGSSDGNGNPIVVPCGGPGSPAINTMVTAPLPPQQTFQCRANPLTGRTPPIC